MFKYIFALILIALAWAIVIILGLPDWIAIVATIAIVGILVAIILYRRARAMKAARDIERALSAQADEHARTVRPEQQGEIRAMQTEFNRAVESLKNSKLGKTGADALYSLPWYMIIGPPGAGKSTALRQSGLQFPYLTSTGGGIKGVGGTRNCEWWLTNDAVLLDTAGRYTTEEEDRDEWFSFLDLLKKFRPRKPINGVLVAVSLGDLGGAHEEDVAATARRCRERVDEVMSRLQMTVPVYLLFTKCDLIPGFVETFGDLRKDERGQIWGFTVPLAQRVAAPGDMFRERFDELANIIEHRALRRMSRERRMETREKIYEFPQQFAVVRNNLADFVATLFAGSDFSSPPTMRGVYFTSGTQEGRPIDRVMSAMADAFGIRNRAITAATTANAESKSYFLRDVFAKVVFPDSDVAARSIEEVRRERRRRLAIAAGAFGLALLLSVLPAFAYWKNRDLVRSTNAIAEAVAAHRARPNAGPLSLSALEPLRTRVGELYEYENGHPPLSMRLGMYQGSELYPHLRDLYTSVLRRDVLDPIVNGQPDGLARSLADFGQRYQEIEAPPSSTERSQYYDQLKMYLLLTNQHEANQPVLDNTLQTWLSGQVVNRWASRLNVREDDQQSRVQMLSNARFYTQLLANDPRLSFNRDPDNVRRVRSALTRVSVTVQALDAIINDVERQNLGLTLPGVIGNTITSVRGTGTIRGAFTRQGWEAFVRDRLNTTLETINGEVWVLGRDPNVSEAARRAEQLRQLRSQYFAMYIDEWRNFLGTIRVAEPADHTQALAMLQELTTGAPTPYGRLFRTTAFNVHLEDPPAPVQNAGATSLRQSAERGVINQIRRRLGRFGNAATNAIDAQVAQNRQGTNVPDDQLFVREDVEDAFEGFFSFGSQPAPNTPAPGANGQPAAPPAPAGPPPALPEGAYEEQLAAVRDALVTYIDNPSAPHAPLLTALQTARTRVDALINTQEVGWRPRFRALLWPPIDFTVRRAMAALGSGTGQRWCTAVAVPFYRTLRDRYPFNPNGHDAALADLADFFRPDTGILWGFYGQNLRGDIPRVGEQYRFDTRLGDGSGQVYREELERFLNRAQDISTVTFPARATDPLVQFEVRIRPEPTVATLTLDVDGQIIEYHNGPEQWHMMRWPGTAGAHGASFRVRGGQGGIDETIAQEGEWGLFRLLEQGQIRGDPAARIFSVTWTLRDMNLEVGVDIRPARSENPFLGVPRADNNGSVFLRPFRGPDAEAPRVIANGGDPCDIADQIPGAHHSSGGSGSGGSGGAAPASGRRHHRHHHSSGDAAPAAAH